VLIHLHLLSCCVACRAEDGSFFANFLAQTKNMTPDERAQALDDNQVVSEEHESIASAGVTDAVESMNTNLRQWKSNAQQTSQRRDGRRPPPTPIDTFARRKLLIALRSSISSSAAFCAPCSLRVSTSSDFICFLEHEGSLYELDGRKAGPVNHGPTTPESLLKDSVKVIRGFMERDPDNVQFNMVALGPA
jgi:hypothetical protein